jgi:hypothetical protein
MAVAEIPAASDLSLITVITEPLVVVLRDVHSADAMPVLSKETRDFGAPIKVTGNVTAAAVLKRVPDQSCAVGVKLTARVFTA